MKNRFPFSLEKLRKLTPAPSGKRSTFHDTRLPFLKCLVTDRGSKSLVIVAKIRGRTRKKLVHRLQGKDLDPCLETLRIRARDIYMDMTAKANGFHPGAMPTFLEYVEVWKDSAEMRTVTPDWRETKLAAVKNHCGSILNLKLDEIRRSEVRILLTDLNSKFERNASIVRGIISQVFELAIDDGVLPEDHSVPIPPRLRLKRNKRERRLAGNELARLYSALEAYQGNPKADAISIRLIVLLALFTAQRRGNILSMRWDEIDVSAGIWTIPPEKTKTRKIYRIGLHPLVQRFLHCQRRNLMSSGRSGPWVFPSMVIPGKPIWDIKKPWAWILREANLKDFRFHDLRHSAASIAYEESQDLKGTQLFLQHSDSRTTADRYIHTVDVGPQVRASGAVLQAVCEAAGISEDNIEGILDDGSFDRDNAAV